MCQNCSSYLILNSLWVFFFILVLADDDEIPQELLLGKEQLSELASESAKIKAMGITCKVQ